ncbi:MAG TPA: BMP family ABC transporter substrate-binding protein [Roseiarcus sp.]|nr:BMP family ABC transporter substrate-binding protein [Roseiarcus sp.]
MVNRISGYLAAGVSATFGLALLASSALAADTVKPAVIYDLGGKFDKSFNEGVFNGASKFTKEAGLELRDLELQNEAQREQALRKFAKDGFSPIVVPGFAWADALGKVAGEFPQTKFTIIDMVVDKPNVQSLLFKAEEGSYLVGVIAAKTSKTGKVGFVGGMDIPLISAFECGYAQGVKATNGSATVIANMTGTTPQAWNDPVKGGELAKAQIGQGADVVYAAAGATGQGVLKAAADAGKFGIGVDSDQDNLFPGKVLTSMLKRVDIATYNTFKSAKDGTWKPGVQVLGLKEGGVGYAQDEWNKAVLSDEAKKAAEAARADIIAGKIQVHDYQSDKKCPV